MRKRVTSISIANVFCTILLMGFLPATAAKDELRDAISLYNSKDYKTAAPLFFKLAYSSKTPTATYYLALCYQQMHAQQRALELFKQICKQWPESVEARLADTYLSKSGFSTKQPIAADALKTLSSPAPAVKQDTPELTKAEWDRLPAKTRIPYLKEHGHMMVQAKINGKYCKMALDTGSTNSGISKHDFPDVLSASELAKAKDGAVSRPHGISMVKECVTEISLQDVTRKTKMFVTDEPNVSVIGQNFFQEYSYQIDDFYIRLTKSPYQSESDKHLHHPAMADKYSVPFERFQNIMLINAEINGQQVKVCFDTGCGADGIVCHPADFGKLGLSVLGPGYAEGAKAGRNWSIADRIVVGPITKMHVNVYPAEGLLYPLIGPKIFDRPYTVDQKTQLIKFDY